MKRPSNLSDSLHHRLNSYALAASAAGVSLLALAQPAEGKIVYTPADVVLTSRPPSEYDLDLNHDGIRDFVLTAYYASGRSSHVSALLGSAAAASNRVWGLHGFDSALPRGAQIGPKGFRLVGNNVMAVVDSNTYADGPWANHGKGVRNRYLGLKFAIKGKIHYGWARLNVRIMLLDGSPITATLTGYAYETIPNKPIIAGKEHGGASLGALAAGSTALSSRQHKIRSR